MWKKITELFIGKKQEPVVIKPSTKKIKKATTKAKAVTKPKATKKIATNKAKAVTKPKAKAAPKKKV